MFAAFIYHLHVLRAESPLQLGFYRRLDGACCFHVPISGSAQEMRHHLGSYLFRRIVGFQSLQPQPKFSEVFHVHRVIAAQHR